VKSNRSINSWDARKIIRAVVQNELRGFQDRHRDDYSIVWLTMKPKHFEREVRRSRHLLASINVEGRAHCECQVLDISTHGAKVVAGTPSAFPDRFELAFFEGGQSRVCEVVWRRAKMLGVKFIF
jgi:hypothetical protein